MITDHSDMTWLDRLKRPPWRTVVPVAIVMSILGLIYVLWSPGEVVTDGRHDRGSNAIWLQHGWLGDDGWFERNHKVDRINDFRDRDKASELAALLRAHHIRYVYPHLAPTNRDGTLPPVHEEQAELFLDVFQGFRVLPWVGGAWGNQAHPEDSAWRTSFVESICDLLEKYPALAGIHLNIEPCPSGNDAFILLLQELRTSIPAEKLISVAAYPPPTRWHPFPEVHWEQAYFSEVASHVDQMVVMMYDTSLHNQKLYRDLMRRWTRQAVDWSGDTDVLLGLAAYDDADTDYHDPDVENLWNGLAGVHAGLLSYDKPPNHYQGIAVYSEWEMQPEEWALLTTHFNAAPGRVKEKN